MAGRRAYLDNVSTCEVPYQALCNKRAISENSTCEAHVARTATDHTLPWLPAPVG